MAEIRQLVSIGPEFDFLTLSDLAGEKGNLRDRVSRWEAGIGSIASANAFLMSEAAAVIDPRFGGESRFSEDCHVPIVDGTDLRNVFCFRSECLISVKANRGREGFTPLLLSRGMGQTGGIKKVTLARWLDGSTHVLCGGKELPTAGISSGMDERVAM